MFKFENQKKFEKIPKIKFTESKRTDLSMKPLQRLFNGSNLQVDKALALNFICSEICIPWKNGFEINENN